jgi:hypothetical protein
MNQKIKMLVFAAVLLGLDVTIIALQSRRIHAAETLQPVLTKKNASLQSSVNRLRAQLRDAQAAQAQTQPLASVPDDGAKYIPVRLDAIKATNIKISGSTANSNNDTGPWVLSLSSDAISWLGLSSEEASQVQNIFSQLQDHIEGHFRATAQEIPEEDAADLEKISKTMAGMAGRYSYYVIPPLGGDDVAALQPWLSSSLTAAIGEERALRSPRRVIGNAVPPELSFLFEPANDDPAIRRKLIAPTP